MLKARPITPFVIATVMISLSVPLLGIMLPIAGLPFGVDLRATSFVWLTALLALSVISSVVALILLVLDGRRTSTPNKIAIWFSLIGSFVGLFYGVPLVAVIASMVVLALVSTIFATSKKSEDFIPTVSSYSMLAIISGIIAAVFLGYAVIAEIGTMLFYVFNLEDIAYLGTQATRAGRYEVGLDAALIAAPLGAVTIGIVALLVAAKGYEEKTASLFAAGMLTPEENLARTKKAHFWVNDFPTLGLTIWIASVFLYALIYGFVYRSMSYPGSWSPEELTTYVAIRFWILSQVLAILLVGRHRREKGNTLFDIKAKMEAASPLESDPEAFYAYKKDMDKKINKISRKRGWGYFGWVTAAATLGSILAVVTALPITF